MINGVVHCLNETVNARSLFAQSFLVALQCAHHIIVTASHDLFDVIEWDVQLTVEQNLLQAQYSIFSVVAIAIIAHAGWLEEADLVIVMQGAGCDSCKFGELFYSEHGTTINPDVTLMSRAGTDFEAN